jgi:hypothetical protein
LPAEGEENCWKVNLSGGRGRVPAAVVVLGVYAEQIREGADWSEATLSSIQVWAEGMATSISLGIRSLHHGKGAGVMTYNRAAGLTRSLTVYFRPRRTSLASTSAHRWELPRVALAQR